MVAVVNPLDHFDSVLPMAIALTYHYVIGESHPPTLDELLEFLAPHFFQEMSIHVIVTEQFSLLDVEDEEELISNIQDGVYNKFVPDAEALKFYLSAMGLNYLEHEDNRYVMRNDCIVEVW